MECYNCIKQAVCKLNNNEETNEDVGLCEKCCKCPFEDCENNISNRVYWRTSGGIILFQEVCEKHTKSAHSVANKVVIPYTYTSSTNNNQLKVNN